MFTGIIEAIGQIADLTRKGGDLSLYVRTGALDLTDVALGDSIAVNGVCLTVVDLTGDGFHADVSLETLRYSAFDRYAVGAEVNLEKALTPQTRLGGHIVTGHIDGQGRILSRRDEARSVRFCIEAPAAIAHYIAAKGSIAVDGASLTVNAVQGSEFALNIVPHTLEQTILRHYSVGQLVNLEVDIIARYLERLLLRGSVQQHQGHADDHTDSAAGSALSPAFLAEHGFLKL